MHTISYHLLRGRIELPLFARSHYFVGSIVTRVPAVEGSIRNAFSEYSILTVRNPKTHHNNKNYLIKNQLARKMSASDDVTTRGNNSDINSKSSNDNQHQDGDLNGLEILFQAAVKIESNDEGKNQKIDDGETNDSKDHPQSSQQVDIDAKVSEEATPSSTVDASTKDSSDSLHRIASLIRNAKQILVLSGAGVSVSAGIPDFRTPGTGLYDNLQKYSLPYAEAVFDIEFYTTNPHPFVQLASELWPDHHYPTITHSFIALLGEKQQLLRNYTQNIDGLESMAGLSDDLLVECHGHFRSASCIRCKKAAPMDYVKDRIVNQKEVPICEHCTPRGSKITRKGAAYIKPDIVFFGENLPNRFYDKLPDDVEKADLCIVMGTSLQVPPTAYIPEMVHCARVLLNRELVGSFNKSDDMEDVFEAGDCDDSVLSIARILGWDIELQAKHDELIKTLTAKRSNKITQ